MEQNKLTVAISSDFLTAFAALPRKIQGKVTEFINKFRNNPLMTGINYEKINGAADDKICSVRIDDTYRGIVARQEETGVYIMLWIDHHDEAYEWATRKKIAVNKLTGNIQVFDVISDVNPVRSDCSGETSYAVSDAGREQPDGKRSSDRGTSHAVSDAAREQPDGKRSSDRGTSYAVFDAAREQPDGKRSSERGMAFDAANESSGQPNLFSMVSNDSLIRLGVPEDIIPLIRSFRSVDEFYQAKPGLPTDTYEVLEYLANGFSFDEVRELFQEDAGTGTSGDDLAKALQSDRGKTSFIVIEGEEELRRIMAEPLEKWRIFLHPAQRKLVEKDFSGSYSVLGGAGTGKTVVAMHRAKYLAAKSDKERILFTTFTANLASDIKDNLRKICSVPELRRIEVIHLDAWVEQFLRQHGYTYTVAYDKTMEAVWDEAIALSGEDTGFNRDFFADEWSKVVAAQESFTMERYMKASRVGRGARLDRKKRMQVWSVFEEYMTLMKEKQLRDVDTAMYECRLILEKNQHEALYSSIIVDEGQDFSSNAYRLLRALADGEHSNDIFIAGDTHQRIYKKKAVLSHCGINVRGRSSRLRINYRTTEEIRKYAFAFLKDISFDNLDDEYEDSERCQSLTHGDYPYIKNFKLASEEYGFIVDEVKRLTDSGIDHKDICLVARTHNLLDDYVRAFRDAGIRVYEIKRSKPDDRNLEGIRIATMHRVKGLEFQYVFVAAANSRVIPHAKAIDDTDEVTRQASLTSEKCLLYVALTRARKAAYITSYGTPSEFLPNVSQ